MEKFDNYKKEGSTTKQVVLINDYGLNNNLVSDILKGETDLDFYYYFSEYQKGINILFKEDIGYELISNLENYISLFLKEYLNDEFLDTKVTFKFSYLSKIQLYKIWKSESIEENFNTFFLIKFRNFISKNNLGKLPNINGTLVFDKRDEKDFGFNYEYDRNNRELGLVEQINNETEEYSLKISKLLKIKTIYDDIEDLIDYISYEKDVLSVELKKGEFYNKFLNINNFISENSIYFSEYSDEGFMFYFINIFGFISNGNLEKFGDFEKELYGNGYKYVNKDFYDEIKDNMFNFIKYVETQKQANF